MFKSPVFRSFWLRLGLELLAWEAVIVGLTWLFYTKVGGPQRYPFGDALFLVAVVEVLIASAAMMGRPYDVSYGPWSVTAFPVQPTEQEWRVQLLEELIEKKRFSTRLIATGLMTFLLSVILTYMF